jgi:hypothetical protein
MSVLARITQGCFPKTGVHSVGAKARFSGAPLSFCRQVHRGGELAGRRQFQTKPPQVLIATGPIGSPLP